MWNFDDDDTTWTCENANFSCIIDKEAHSITTEL